LNTNTCGEEEIHDRDGVDHIVEPNRGKT